MILYDLSFVLQFCISVLNNSGERSLQQFFSEEELAINMSKWCQNVNFSTPSTLYKFNINLY